MPKNTKTEESILFPEVKVGNIVIKPWSFGKLFDLSLLLDKALTKLDESGVDIEKALSESTISYLTIAKFFSLVSEEILDVISITLDKDKEEIKKLSMEDGIKTAFVIFNQNKEIIKNAFSSLTK